MTTTHPTDQTTKHRELDEVATAEVLQQAVQHRAPVQVVANGMHEAEVWRGSFAKLMPEWIEFTAVEPHTALPDAWQSFSLRTTFCVDRKPYSFVSRLATSSGRHATGTIALKRPEAVFYDERRSATRRRLRQGVPVRLTPKSTSRDSTSEPIEARLLNLSETGLACLIEDAQSAQLSEGATVRLVFQLPDVPQPFALDAVVITKTRGVGHHQVIGVEFVADESLHYQSARLRQSLRAISAERRCGDAVGAGKESDSL